MSEHTAPLPRYRGMSFFTDAVWDEKRTARLVAMRADGASTLEISLRLGVTPNAVVGKAKRLGLPARPSPIRAPLDAEGRTRRMPKAKREEVFAQVAQSHAARPPRTDTLAHIRRLSAVASLPIPPVRTCQWMEGERFAYVACGQRVKAGKPYCACHAAIAYKPRWVA